MGSRVQRACWVLMIGIGALISTQGRAAVSAQTDAPAPAELRCIAEPATVMAGETVHVTGELAEGSPGGQAPGAKPPEYMWSTTGGQISTVGTAPRVSTAGLQPGDYVVTGRARTSRRKSQIHECRAAFRVVGSAPPSIACSASPTRIVPGAFTSITAVAKSALGWPLSYSYGATAGQITGTGPSATLAAVDVNPGTITVKCNVVDDRGQAATATIAVEVMPPPPPPLAPAPAARSLCSVSFARDRKRPMRVDNEAKGCLDDIALQLTRDASAKLVIVGDHDTAEKPDAAAERTLNVKQYMTAEKGIDGSRIQVRTGENTGRLVENVLVPQGARWDPVGTTEFDVSQVEQHGEPYSHRSVAGGNTRALSTARR